MDRVLKNEGPTRLHICLVKHKVNCCVTNGVTFILESNLLRQDEMEGLVVISPKQVIGWVFLTVRVFDHLHFTFFLLVVLLCLTNLLSGSAVVLSPKELLIQLSYEICPWNKKENTEFL